MSLLQTWNKSGPPMFCSHCCRCMATILAIWQGWHLSLQVLASNMYDGVWSLAPSLYSINIPYSGLTFVHGQ